MRGLPAASRVAHGHSLPWGRVSLLWFLAVLVSWPVGPAALPAQEALAPPVNAARSPYARWDLGPPADPAFFPVGVWLQDPRHAERYARLGVNTYVGLWQGPTEEQLERLAAAGMKVVCALNEVGLAHLDDPTIVAWMLPDEPDNRETKPDGSKRVRHRPDQIRTLYERLRERDPRRPVWLNLGQGVANDDFKGRGARLVDYPDYAAACDILSFDVYPVANLKRADGGELLWYLAKGLQRLRRWGGPEKVLWNFVECTSIHDPALKATPEQVRAEVWIALVHGSRGIVWFVHQFQPELDTTALFKDRAMMAMVQRINAEVAAFAPALNGPDLEGVTVASASAEVPVALLAKRDGEDLLVFSVGLRNAPTEATFRLGEPAPLDVAPQGTVEVVGEGRTLPLEAGTWRDAFEPWGVHVYRLRAGG